MTTSGKEALKVKEEMIMTEFKKLQFEIENLQSTLDKNVYDKMMTRINTVIAFFGLSMGK